MALPALLRVPGFVRWGIRIDIASTGWWLGAQFLALWPAWIWMARRMLDGSDDPLGLLALTALGWFVWRARRELRASPRLGWLALAIAGTVAATVAQVWLPPLVAGLIAVLALAAALLAFLPQRMAGLPVAGLSVLALPLLSSLQFYAGYPLRVITAEASRWLLAPFHTVQREGSALMVDGLLVIVDAPCSGVQMAWLGYFTACATALWAGRSNTSFMARLPLVSVLVLAGNIVRNTALVAWEASGSSPPAWLHSLLGLAVLAMVCGGIAWAMSVRVPHMNLRGGRHAPTA